MKRKETYLVYGIKKYKDVRNTLEPVQIVYVQELCDDQFERNISAQAINLII